MTVTRDPSLASALDALALPGVLIGHRLISPGDEDALLPQEARAFATECRQSAAGEWRRAHRRAPAAGAIGIRALRRAESSVGSADLARRRRRLARPRLPGRSRGRRQSRDVAALGIDVEPAESLPSDLLDWSRRRGAAEIADDPYHGRLLFAAKEAVYKAVYPLDQTFLDHHDVQISLADRKATVRNGRLVELRFGISTHLVALAFLRGQP